MQNEEIVYYPTTYANSGPGRIKCFVSMFRDISDKRKWFGKYIETWVKTGKNFEEQHEETT